jgi:predicted nucleic acid-binding protein
MRVAKPSEPGSIRLAIGTFDRMLASQALERGLTIVSVDEVFDRYGVSRLW